MDGNLLLLLLLLEVGGGPAGGTVEAYRFLEYAHF